MNRRREEAGKQEMRVRDLYAERLTEFRPEERLLTTEAGYASSLCRADMRTIDRENAVREWEFKLVADYRALGQVLHYAALALRERDLKTDVRPVLAAFEFIPDLDMTIRLMTPAVELVTLPSWLRVDLNPRSGPLTQIPLIPRQSKLDNL